MYSKDIVYRQNKKESSRKNFLHFPQPIFINTKYVYCALLIDNLKIKQMHELVTILQFYTFLFRLRIHNPIMLNNNCDILHA